MIGAAPPPVAKVNLPATFHGKNFVGLPHEAELYRVGEIFD
jgi:hypothetical protein